MFLSLLVAFFTSASHANVLGDMQTFAPNTDGLDFITLHSSRPLTKGYFSLGGHFSYAKDHLVVFRDTQTQDRLKYKDALGEFDFDFAYGLSRYFSLTFAVTNLLYYEPEPDQEFKASASTGTHTYRPGFKWTLFPKSFQMALLTSVDIPNVENSPFFGVDAKPIYNIELAKNFKSGKSTYYGLNLGYRVRSPGEPTPDSRMYPLDDQITFSVGRSAPIVNHTKWIVEAIGSVPAQKAPYKNAMDASSFDILIGVKHRLRRNLNFDYGGTFEPFVDSMAPRYRVFAGLVYYFNLIPKNPRPPPPPLPEPEEKAEPLVVHPQVADVIEGTSVQMKVSGGLAPYKFRVVSGSGRLYPTKGIYRAALKTESAVIEVTDQSVQTKMVTINSKPAPKPDEIISLRELNFIFNTATLIESSKVDALEMIKSLRTKKVKRLIIEGHTDDIGTDEYNIELSEKRAQTIADILIRELNLSPEDVQAVGFGETKPIARNTTPIGRQLNRRVDIKVYLVSK